MEGFLLTVLGEAPGGPVVPRRIVLALEPGTGRLHLPPTPRTDAEWQASVAGGWEAAMRLTGRRDADARLAVAATGPLRGGSAGLEVGFLAMAGLLGEPLPPHFSTGAVLDGDGFLAGGAAAPPKAAAAAQVAAQLGLEGAAFVAPPEAGPAAGGLPLLRAADLGSAYGLLTGHHGRIAHRHRALRQVAGPHGRGRFARVYRPPGLGPLPVAVGDIAVFEAGPSPPGAVLLEVGEDHMLSWRIVLLPSAALAEEVPRCWALGRACSLR